MYKKCCFIIPYFGEFPNYFNLFLKSCKFNEDYDWLIITDNLKKYEYPDNVHILRMTFNNLKAIFSEKLGFEVVIQNYHKLCDYKPIYGFIFEDQLKSYDFWGYCDLDLLFGDLNYFITDDMLSMYDKLFCLGHLTMIKNTHENNRIFLRDYKGECLYKKVFTSEKTMIFDEPYGIGKGKSINDLFLYYGKKVYLEDLSLNLKIAPANIVRTYYESKNGTFEDIKYKNSIFLWEKGQIVRVYTDSNKKISKQYYLYIHFQSRKMKVRNGLGEKFKILGDGFYPLEYYPINLKNFNNIKKRIVSLRYFRIQYRWKINGIKRKVGRIFKHEK